MSSTTTTRVTSRTSHLLTGPALAVIAAIVALGVRFFMVISKSAVNIFFYDQWDFLTPFFRHEPTIAKLFFWQHGPHREGVGLIADKFLYPLTHWNTRVDSFLIGGIIVVAMLLALHLKRKLFGAISYSDVAIPVIFLTLVQYETLLGTPNPAHAAFPLLLTMLYCLALLVRKPLLRYSLILALNFVLVYTGFGFFMGIVTIGVFLLECYWSLHQITSVPFGQPFIALIVAVALLASFFVHYTYLSGVDCFEIPRHHLLHYPEFMALMFSAFVVPRLPHVSSEVIVLGAATVMVVVAVLGRHLLYLVRDAGALKHLVGAVLLTFSLLFAANAAVGRACLGLDAAFSSRYTTLLIPAFLAIYFYLLSRSWRGKRNFVLTLWVLLLLPSALRKPYEEIRWFSDGKRAWANCYLARHDIQECDALTHFQIYPRPEATHLQEKLDFLERNHLNLFDNSR